MMRLLTMLLLVNGCATLRPLDKQEVAALPKAVRDSFADVDEADGAKRLTIANGSGSATGPAVEIDWRVVGSLVSLEFIEPLGGSLGSINFAEDTRAVAVDPNSKLKLLYRFGLDDTGYVTVDDHSLALRPTEIATVFTGYLPMRWRNLISSAQLEKNPNHTVYRLRIADADRLHDVIITYDRKMQIEEFCSTTSWTRFFGLGSRSVVVCSNGTALRNGSLLLPHIVQLRWLDVSE